MDALWDGGPLGADRLKPQHTPPLQEPGDECHFIPSVFVVTARLCDPFLCLCGHCAFFISQLHTCKVVCGCFSHGCSAFAFAKSDGHIAHRAKALKTAAVVRLHSPVAHFGTLHFDLYKIHVKFPDCILHGRLWLTDTCQQTDTQRRCK